MIGKRGMSPVMMTVIGLVMLMFLIGIVAAFQSGGLSTGRITDDKQRLNTRTLKQCQVVVKNSIGYASKIEQQSCVDLRETCIPLPCSLGLSVFWPSDNLKVLLKSNSDGGSVACARNLEVDEGSTGKVTVQICSSGTQGNLILSDSDSGADLVQQGVTFQ